jgi:ABC-2 type transport system permease protein
MISITALMAFSRFELELFFKTYIAVAFTYIAPCMIFGFSVSSQPLDKRPAALAAMYPVILGVIILFVALYTLGTQVVGYREMGFYKRILITRIRPVSIALSNAIRGFVLVLIGLVILSAEGWLLFGIKPSYNILQSLIAILFAGGGIFLLGLIPACFVKRTQSMFAVASISSYILVFFSGVMPNYGNYFNWMAHVVKFWPSYHALRVLRAGFAGVLFQPSILGSMVYLIGLVAVCLLFLRRFLSWM